mmetsp:Transcript_71678/g.135200  ORF Transcript_71678/g.135200 Transcript_71678/m.135200 type:complete len:738 (-) Transcript_71678:214-2427(-)
MSPPTHGVAHLLRTDGLTQFAAVVTVLLLFTTSKFINETGKSEADIKKMQHAEAIHRQLWRYSRDKMSSATALRLRFLATGLMSMLWAAVFARQLFGLRASGAGLAAVAVGVGFGCLFGAFELQTRQDKTEEGEAIPVTIVTGWLGAGKTTMIQHILRESRGKRILVVENEAGSVGVDHDLLVGKGDIGEEEVVLLQNGCVCCSVRSDLGRVLKEQLKRNQRARARDAKQAGQHRSVAGVAAAASRLLLAFLDRTLMPADKATEKEKEEEEKKKKESEEGKEEGGNTSKSGAGESGESDGRAFDAIILETTGMALVSPIIQLFFADAEVRKQTKLDAVITVVDARHVWNHLKVLDHDKDTEDTQGAQELVVNAALGGREEVLSQIAYADRVVVNKVDLCVATSESENGDQGREGPGQEGQDQSRLEAESPSKRTVVVIEEDSGSDNDNGPDDTEVEKGVASGGAVESSRTTNPLPPLPSLPSLPLMHLQASSLSPSPPPSSSSPLSPPSPQAVGKGGEAKQLETPLAPVSSSTPKSSPKSFPKSAEDVCLAVRSLNPRCDILTAVQGQVPVTQLLGIKAFDLKCQVIPASLAAPSSTTSKQTTKLPTGGSFGVAGSSVFQTNQYHRTHKSMVDTFTLVHESDGKGGNEVDLDKFNSWLPTLLNEHGEKLYRLKGFLAVKGETRKLVCQGVHMTFTGERGDAWAPGEARKSTLVFIGKAPLPRAKISAALERCLTPTK